MEIFWLANSKIKNKIIMLHVTRLFLIPSVVNLTCTVTVKIIVQVKSDLISELTYIEQANPE
jgi:hypothetical protein